MSFITDTLEERELKSRIMDSLDSARTKLKYISKTIGKFNENKTKFTTIEFEILNEELKEIKKLTEHVSYNVLANSIMNPTKISDDVLLSDKVSNLLSESNKIIKEDK